MHKATKRFWLLYRELPSEVKHAADKQFANLKANPHHGSLQFKKVSIASGQELWSARVTLNYRALAYRRADGFTWFWIGDHGAYDMLLNRII